MAQASYHDMAVQAIYQGVIVNVLALMCVAYAIRHLGTITVALFMSFVPVTTALLAWLALGEALKPWEIAGIVGCSMGLLWYSREPRSQALNAVKGKKGGQSGAAARAVTEGALRGDWLSAESWN